ncbi:gephyrin-like molybdotransferase Glp [Sulfuriflexus sp.]|uniref:molybdopterin molybdotransferase MoeA n=1 Tax=Sulfuriflexus sp. TaxID=2015443 RepID=UPI0028CCD7D5|nr:gephyrin-like molybdotransferase Glp [Sulfuriflexus sp.]MDT8405223.1 molybdopterin molybdotransferase MoeA [Sulfuriflexus sp.]
MSDPCFNPTDRMLTADEAINFLLERARPVSDMEQIDLFAARGRVLAEAVLSTIDVPPADNTAMDGYAVRANDVANDGILTVTQRIPAGVVGKPLNAGEAARIFTGAPIPEGADAVVMQEQCSQDRDKLTVNTKVCVGDHIRRRGEDIQAGAEILPAGTRLRPQDMGLIASVGIPAIKVWRRPRVAIFSTGDELVAPGEQIGPGQIYNSNRFILNGLLQTLDCEIIDLGSVPDSLEATVQALQAATRDADLIMTTGGVSVGEEDYVKAALDQLGSVDMWRVAMKPGKPVAFGQLGESAFIGLPGNPVSAFATFCLFARPFILRMMGVQEVMPRRLPVTADFDWPKEGPRREFVRAQLRAEDGLMKATLYPAQGSGVLTSTVWADGFVEIPEHTTVKQGDSVTWLDFLELLS